MYCSGKGNRERSGIIKHSLHNGVVLTMENRVLLFPLMLGGFVHYYIHNPKVLYYNRQSIIIVYLLICRAVCVFIIRIKLREEAKSPHTTNGSVLYLSILVA